MKDILITKGKDKKSNVIPQTKKAKKVFKESIEGEDTENGFEIFSKDANKILTWAITHNLSVDSKVSFTIPALPFITQKEIAKALGNENIPASFLPRKLFPIGKAKFKGDNFTGELKKLSVNDQFEKGKEYPIFDHEGLFVIGKNGKGYKITPKAWSKITSY